MAMMLKPETEARIADLAKRLGFAGQNAMDQVLKMALDALDAKTPPARCKMTAEELEAEYSFLSAAGRRWREEHPDEYSVFRVFCRPILCLAPFDP